MNVIGAPRHSCAKKTLPAMQCCTLGSKVGMLQRTVSQSGSELPASQAGARRAPYMLLSSAAA